MYIHGDNIKDDSLTFFQSKMLDDCLKKLN